VCAKGFLHGKDKIVIKNMLVVAVLALGMVGAKPVLGTAQYQVIDLGILQGGSQSTAYKISSLGCISGQSAITDGAKVACAWDETNAIFQIPSLGGQSWGYAVNDNGEVVGRSYVGDYRRAFIWDQLNGTRELPLLPDGIAESVGYAINNAGQITGNSDIGGIWHAALWQWNNGAETWEATDIAVAASTPETESYRNSSGTDITASGNKIIGFRGDGNNIPQAFVWQFVGGVWTRSYLTVSGSHMSYTEAINENNQGVGYVAATYYGGTPWRAYVWDNITGSGVEIGTWNDIGTLGGRDSYAYDINNSGLVVGESDYTGTPGVRHAFIWKAGAGMTDLNTLIDPASGWELVGANGINDDGKIVGYGKFGGQTRAFLLTLVGPSLQGTVVLQNYPPGPNGVQATVSLRGSTTTNNTVTLDSAGHFSIPNVTAGTYDVWVKPGHWLAKLTGGVVVGPGNADIGTVSVINGDCDGDNEVTSTDLSIILGALNGNYNSQADLNGDNLITGTDLSIGLTSMDLVGN
jgi:probable HAF family extracellular repeat protein